MPRGNAMVPPDAIRIEDEVWQEAFTRREPARPNRERRLQAIDGDLPDWLVETTGNTLAEAASWSVQRPARERTRSGRRAAAYVRAEPVAPAVATPTVALAPQPRASAAGAVVDERALDGRVLDEPALAPSRFTQPPRVIVDVASAQAGAPPGAASLAPTGATPARRTVKIQGRGAERNLPLPDSSRRRPQPRAYERSGFRPDRLAMWAVMLGFMLVLIAILSAHG